MKSVPLTTQLHNRLEGFIRVGDKLIDATVGNGHDTLFLAQQAGDTGRVYAIDIQPASIANAKQRLEEAGLAHRVDWFCAGHEAMQDFIDRALHGTFRLVVFNLGYLPGSDKSIKTTADTTLPALQQAYDLLVPGGALSVMAYPGHAGGEQEAGRVKDWFNSIEAREYALLIPDSQQQNAPQWHWLVKPA